MSILKNKIAKDMKNIAKSILGILLLTSIFSLQGCSSDDENSETSNLIAKLTQGCYHDDDDDGKVLRFFSDNTLLYTKNNDASYGSSYDVYIGQWRVENEKDIVIQWDDEEWKPSSAPEFMLNPTFISGKMSFIDHKNENRMFTNAYPTTLVRETLVNKYLCGEHTIQYQGQTLKLETTLELFPYNKQDANNEDLLTKNFSLLVWEGRGKAEWKSEATYADTGKVYATYKATSFYVMNLTENSIFFTSWFYENGVGTDVDIFKPPYGMTDLRTDKNDNGDMLIFFQNGYYNYRETNFVVRDK